MYLENYYPQFVLLEITNACNLRCLHCGSRSGKCRAGELTTQEFKDLITELVGLGAQAFTVIGGEPLVRNDWDEICGQIRSLGARVCIGTNGTLITPKVIERAEAIDLNGFGVSIDGTEQIHDYIRQRPGAFREAMHAIKLIKGSTTLDTGAMTTVSKLNLDVLEDLYLHLSESECDKWRLQLAIPAGRMEEHREEMLSDEEYEGLVDRILAMQERGSLEISVGTNVAYCGTKAARLRNGMPFTGDYLGTRLVAISANGNVKGDLTLPDQFIEGNIRNKSFTQIWQSDDTFSYNRKFNMDMVGGFCRECRYLPLCKGGDAPISFAANGVRANPPYCMYRIEHARGEEPVDSPLTKSLLERCHQPVNCQQAG